MSLYAELAAATLEFEPIRKDREVEVISKKTGVRYKFRYATFEHIVACVKPALSRHGFVLMQTMEHDEHGDWMETHLLHDEGCIKGGRVPVLMANDAGPQEAGSAESYAQRYSLRTFLCLASDDDDDGNIASGNDVQKSQTMPPRPKPAAPTLDIDTPQPGSYMDKKAKGLLVKPDIAAEVFPDAAVVPTISSAQHKMLEATIREFAKVWNEPPEEIRTRLKARAAADLGVEHLNELAPAQFEIVMGWLAKRPKKP